ncbi:MAK10-like protein [Tanacetum coccineum]
MGDANPIRTLGYYSKPSHKGYRNIIELPSEDPNQHINDFLKLVDSLELDGENRERTRLRLFQFSLCDQASNWLERLPAGSITTWEDLTTRFLAQFFPPGRISKLRNDILMFQQHQGESLSEAWTRGKLRDRNAEESWALLEDLALYDNESWNDPMDFAKPVKAISLPQDVPSTSDRRIIELKNQVQRLMEAYLAPTQTNLKRLVSNFMASQDARLSKFEADFKQQQSEMTNKIDTVLKAITDQIAGALPSHTVKNSKLNTSPVLIGNATEQTEEPKSTLEDEFQDLHLNLPVLKVLAHAPFYNAMLDKYVESLELLENGSTFIQGEVSAKMEDPGLFTLPCRLGDSKPFDTLADLGSCVNIIPLYLFKKLNIGLLEETNHIFGLADGTKSYPVGIVKDVEVHIGKLKLLNDFYVIDMKKDPKTPLLVGRGFLATANAVIYCRKAKIAVGERITRSVFGVKGVSLGAQTPYYARKDFLNCHLPGEWEIARDAEINPFKDVLVFRQMDKPPKDGDGAWHAKIRIIDPDGEEFTKTLQSILTTRRLFERESPREIINLDHFYDT